MTELVDPGLPPHHPRAMYHHDLVSGDSITWYSAEATVESLVGYVLGLLDIPADELRHTPQGNALTADESVALSAVSGARGVALTVWGRSSAGTARINDGITREWEQQQASGPGRHPAPARWTPILSGTLPPEYDGSHVFDFINGADVVPVAGEPRPPQPPAPAPFRLPEPTPPPAAPSAPAAPAAPAPARGVRLGKGGNISLTKQVPALTQISVGLGWDVTTSLGSDVDLDASAIMCTAAGKVVSDDHFVFFNNLASPDGTVVHTGDNLTGEGEGDDESIHVDLAAMSPEVDRIVFAVSIYEATNRRQSFGDVHEAFIRVVDRATGSEIARYDLTEDASVETAMIFGEVYRRDGEWKFRAVGQGYASGLHGIALNFGVDV